MGDSPENPLEVKDSNSGRASSDVGSDSDGVVTEDDAASVEATLGDPDREGMSLNRMLFNV